MPYFDDALEAAGGRRNVIPPHRRRTLIQQWREVYATELHVTTGQWTKLGYDWHVFSYGHARALARMQATFAYTAIEPPPRLFVCPQDGRLDALEIIGGKLPDFSNSGLDVSVWPDGLEWTMAFTHEDGFGPYFSRREWIGIPSR